MKSRKDAHCLSRRPSTLALALAPAFSDRRRRINLHRTGSRRALSSGSAHVPTSPIAEGKPLGVCRLRSWLVYPAGKRIRIRSKGYEAPIAGFRHRRIVLGLLTRCSWRCCLQFRQYTLRGLKVSPFAASQLLGQARGTSSSRLDLVEPRSSPDEFWFCGSNLSVRYRTQEGVSLVVVVFPVPGAFFLIKSDERPWRKQMTTMSSTHDPNQNHLLYAGCTR